MKNESLRNWISGVAFHTHSRLDTLLGDLEERKREKEEHDSMISTQALVNYAVNFTGDNNVLICDTDHPVHVLDRKGIIRKGSFSPKALPATVEVLSNGILERSKILRNSELNQNVLTGVEADILDTEGRLDISNHVLGQLDLVIASFHYSYWKAANNGYKPTKEDCLQSITNCTNNPHVDVIGHPNHEIYKNYTREITIADWQPILKTMAERNVAFEINLYGYRASEKTLGFERSLIEQAARLGVPLIVGLDFHNFFEFQGTPQEGIEITMNNINEIFNSHKGFPNTRMFLRIAKIKKELLRLGVNEHNLLNSSKEKFIEWLRKRNVSN